MGFNSGFKGLSALETDQLPMSVPVVLWVEVEDKK